MDKPKCIKCGTELTWGGFAYEQNTCFDCFKKEVLLIREGIDRYPSWLWDKCDEHKKILNWMMAVIAELYGYEW